MLRCDMCHKPLKGARHQVHPSLRPELILIVGPDCYRKAKKAAKELQARKTPEEIAALRVKITSLNA